MLKSFHLQISCHYTFQPLSSCGNKFQICTVPNLFFHFSQWGRTCAQFTGWNAKTMFQLAEHVSKIILAPDRGPVTNSLELTVRKFFFLFIEKPSTNHNKIQEQNNLIILICQSGNSSETFISDCPLMCSSFRGNFIVLMMRWNHNKGSIPVRKDSHFAIFDQEQIGFVLVASFP